MDSHSRDSKRVGFIPTLYLKDLSAAMDFYRRAFGAVERWKIEHPKGTIHVAEMSIASILFRIHDEATEEKLSPATLHGTSIVVGLLTDDPDLLFERAIVEGATQISPMKDFEYGYRQGTLRDPFGHLWCIERFDDFYKVPTIGLENKPE